MEYPNPVIAKFLTQIAIPQSPQQGRQYLAEILKPVLQLEVSICQAPDGAPTHPYLGLFDVFEVPSEARIVYAREENSPIRSPSDLDTAFTGDTTRFSYFSGTAQALCSFPRHQMFPLRRGLFRRTGAPCIVQNLGAFQDNLEIFAHGALKGIKDWNNIVLTGGCVVASLCGRTPQPDEPLTPANINAFFQGQNYYGKSGLDIFLYGLTSEQARAKVEEIHASISKSALWPVTVVRKAGTISFHTLYPTRPIYVHLKLFTSLAAILAHCDVDCGCCAYDGTTVYVNPRALVALMLQTNTLDLNHWSPAYEIRLAKYAERGFELHVPSLDQERVAYSHVYNRGISKLPLGLSRLLILELHHYMPDHLKGLGVTELERQFPSVLPSPCPDAPVDKRLLGSVEMFWAQIPYGQRWDHSALLLHSKNLNNLFEIQLNSEPTAWLHRHPLHASGELAECLESLCNKCPTMPDEEYKAWQDAEVNRAYFHGPLRKVWLFYKMDSQAKNSLLLLGNSEVEQQACWIGKTYLSDGESHIDTEFQVIPRRFWHKFVANVQALKRGDAFIDVEGAAPSFASWFRVYAALDGYCLRGGTYPDPDDMAVSEGSVQDSSDSSESDSDEEANI